MPLARASLFLTAIAFGGFGVWLLVAPHALSLVGVALTTPSAAIEIRGFYGGMEIGFAVFFAMTAARPAWFAAGLVAQVASLGGMALGRIVGLALEGGAETLIYLLLAAEAAGCLVGAVALARLSASARRAPR